MRGRTVAPNAFFSFNFPGESEINCEKIRMTHTNRKEFDMPLQKRFNGKLRSLGSDPGGDSTIALRITSGLSPNVRNPPDHVRAVVGHCISNKL